MDDPHALDALRLIAPLRPAAHVQEHDLSAAVKDARRALDAGQSAESIFSALHFGAAVSAAGSAQDPFDGRSPGVTKTGSNPSVAATLSYVRASPLARLDPLAPSWARSLKPATTRGPFLNAHGEAFWFDTFLLPRAVTVQAQALWGGPARMLARLPVSTRISPNPRRRLGPGTIWLPAQVLVPLRPASEFVGFQISGGTVGFAGITHSDTGTITLGGAWKVVLRL